MHENRAGVAAVLTEGSTRRRCIGDGPATMDQSGGELELYCSVGRARRGEAWAMNEIGGGRGCSRCLLWGQRRRGEGRR
jgi:hypothetical protein